MEICKIKKFEYYINISFIVLYIAMSIETMVKEPSKEKINSKQIEKREIGPKEKDIPLNPELELNNKKLFESINDAISSGNCLELNKIREDLNKWLDLKKYGYEGNSMFETDKNNGLTLNDISMNDVWNWDMRRMTNIKSFISKRNWKIYFEGLMFARFISIDNQWKMDVGSTFGEDPLNQKPESWINIIPYIWNAWNTIILPQIPK